MPEQKPVNWTNVTTLVALAILVGTEFVGAAWAAGWAMGGLFQLDASLARLLEGAGIVMGLACLYYFMRAAVRNESVRG